MLTVKPTPELSAETQPTLGASSFRLSQLAAGLLILAQLPFLILYGHNLWLYRPHYEFFPVVLVAVVALVWKRWPRATDPLDRPKWFELALFGSGLLLLAASVLIFSPWLAAIAGVLTSGGLLVHFGGRAGLWRLWPVWALLWLVIPPSRYDQTLIDGMQSVTTRASSRILDQLDIGHLRAGNTIELPGKQLFVAEACSGVHSQLVLVACTAIFVVLVRRPLLCAALLIGSAFLWATLVNIIRVTTVAVTAAKSDFDLSTGWAHEALGFGLVGLGLLLVMSTDQLLSMLLAPIDPRSSVAATAGAAAPAAANASNLGTRNPLARLWNRFIACPVSDPSEEDEDMGDEVPDPPSRWRLRSSSPGGRSLVSVFCVLGILELVILLHLDQLGIDPQQITIAFDESSLPAETADWKQLQFTTERRDRSSEEGACSQIWKYTAGNSIAHVSMDYPFVGWHDLTVCYRGRGWHIDSQVTQAANTRSAGAGDFVEVEMSMPTGERGLLLFSLFDGSGRPLSPGGSHWRRIFEKLASNPLVHALGFSKTAGSPDAISVQVQQFLQLQARPTEQERQLATTKFLEFRDRLRDHWRRNADQQ